jgi:glycosyltransferase involved in cell wall biosynthesis
MTASTLRRRNRGPAPVDVAQPGETSPVPVVIATMLRPLGSTGVQTHVRQVQKYLTSRGAPFTLSTPFSWARWLSMPVYAVRLAIEPLSSEASVAWYRWWHYLFLRRALRHRLAGESAAVVYAQCPLSALAALEARRGPDQRVIMTVHFQISQADEWVTKGEIRRDGRVFKAIRLLERRVLPQLDGIVYLSRSTQENLTGWLGEVRAVPSVRIPNFVFATRSEPPAERVADLVTIGGLELFKNHHFLLEVLAEANQLGRRYSLDVMGVGPRLGELERLAADLGVDAQVRFLGFRPDAESLLSGYAAYVHASTSESFCLAIVEAMAAGVPVIAGAVGAIPELFEPALEGRFWPLDDPMAAARILIDLMDDPELRVEMGLAGRARFERQFAADVVGPALFDFLGTPAGSARPAPTNRA